MYTFGFDARAANDAIKMSGANAECAGRREAVWTTTCMHLSLYATAADADAGAVRLKTAQCALEVYERERGSDGKIEEKHGNNETKDDM